MSTPLPARAGSPARVDGAAPHRLGPAPAPSGAAGRATTVTWATTSTDLGWLLVGATGRGLCFVSLGDDPAYLEQRLVDGFSSATFRHDPGALGSMLDAVLRRIAGDPELPDVPIDVAGTGFQRRVWDELRRIPRGEVRTYGDVAAAIGAPRAVRAVGRACGANPVALVVPCHRVLPKRGGVGNYGFGPARKRELLRREGVSVAGDEHDAAPARELD